MNTALINKNKAEIEFQVVANRETVTIALGTPVVFVMDGTKDGIDVQLPSSGNAAKAATLFGGITVGQGLTGGMLAGYSGSSIDGQITQVYGICQKALTMTTITRSATSAVWVSLAASAVGDILSVNTVLNALAWMSNGSAVVNNGCEIIMGQTVASATTAASGAAGTYPFISSGGTASTATVGNGASSDTIAYLTSLVKVFLRAM